MLSFHRSPHYACPEVIRVSVAWWSDMRTLDVWPDLESEGLCFDFVWSLLGREVWRKESRRLELWGHSVCSVGGESPKILPYRNSSPKYNISVNNYSPSCYSKLIWLHLFWETLNIYIYKRLFEFLVCGKEQHEHDNQISPFGKGKNVIEVWQNFCMNYISIMANIFSSVRLNCVESHKQHSNTLYYVACLDSVMDIKVKLTLSECHQRSFSIRNGILWKWTGMFKWRLGIDVSKSQRQSKLEQVWDAPLHCIISRFYLKCFTCASEAQQYPESLSSFEMLVFNFESKIETLESERFISPHWATGLHFKTELDCLYVREMMSPWIQLNFSFLFFSCITSCSRDPSCLFSYLLFCLFVSSYFI